MVLFEQQDLIFQSLPIAECLTDAGVPVIDSGFPHILIPAFNIEPTAKKTLRRLFVVGSARALLLFVIKVSKSWTVWLPQGFAHWMMKGNLTVRGVMNTARPVKCYLCFFTSFGQWFAGAQQKAGNCQQSPFFTQQEIKQNCCLLMACFRHKVTRFCSVQVLLGKHL